MAGYEEILETYYAVSAKSGQMVDAAKCSDWDRLAALEKDCSALVEALKRVDKDASPRNAEYMQRKVALIRKVLNDDAEIRKHTEPWMNRLQVYLGSTRQEQRLLHAYESGSNQG